ncbi:hypothetical protein HWV62_30807 [Athelia sp. TMB]|nr:hypothetical protein HWV62_15162 [Athelia sp. TMB]KAF7981983.1 hypothetical protein HWV62_30807 [Athelia sp. TMB]
MAPVVNQGDQLLIPLLDQENKAVHIQWQQDLSARSADYFALTVDNITTGEQVPFFIAAEFYKNSTKANAKHISKVGTEEPGEEYLLTGSIANAEGYKITVDSNLQYGQKNAAGELRFVVYHDTSRKPYQHRFIETAVASAGAGKAQEIAKSFGFGAIGDTAGNLAKSFVGDYLHTF